MSGSRRPRRSRFGPLNTSTRRCEPRLLATRPLLRLRLSELLEKARCGRAKKVSPFSEVAVRRQGERQKVVLVEDANEGHELVAFERDFFGHPGIEHFGRPLNGLDHDADFGPYRLDIEGSSVLGIDFERDTLEVHEE